MCKRERAHCQLPAVLDSCCVFGSFWQGHWLPYNEVSYNAVLGTLASWLLLLQVVVVVVLLLLLLPLLGLE